MDISRIYIYNVLFFTHFSRNILAASLYTTGYNAHTLKIYMKNTQNIYTGLTKYILTQLKSIELQILYKCLYNNPGMS